MNTLIAVITLGVLCLVFEIFNARKAIVPITILGLFAILGLVVSEYNHPASYYNAMIVVNNFSVVFSGLFIVLTVFLVALSQDVYKDHQTKISDFIAIKIFFLSGAIAMVSFGNLSMFFIGIEVLSIALYILAASNRLSVKSNEAGMKYFLMGSFASGIILFGICLVYGATGSFNVAEIYDLSQGMGIPEWFYIGLTMIIIGMFFKIAAVPFHFWAPDVYEGAPALSTATMSTLAKVVAIATLFKLIISLNANVSEAFLTVVALISVLSMLVGNIMALRQNNVKRMLAFSGISHAGFMLMTLLTINNSAGTLLYYTCAYALAGIASFAVIIMVTRDKDNEDIINFNGLGKTNPLMAAILTGSLLSMAGIPIFAGFFAKFMLFVNTIEAGYIWVVIIAVISSIISVGYYFKLILAMYTREPNEPKESTPFVYSFVGVTAIILNIVIGIFPSIVIDLLK